MTGYYMGVPSPTAIITCLSILLTLDIAVVALRFAARRKLNQSFQADDWLTIPSLILVTGLATVLFYGVSTKSLGYKINSMENPSRGIPTRKLEYATITIAPVALALIKLSCILLYRRIFVVDKENRFDQRNIFFSFAICIIVLWGGGVFLPTLFACRGSWVVLWGDIAPKPGQCIDGFQLGWAFAISDFITDALVIMIPIPFVWSLRLRTTKKVAVTGVFLLGILATLASLLRLLWKQWSKKVGRDPSLDEALMITFGCFWIAVEAQIGLLASCLPTFGSYFKGSKLSSALRSLIGSLSIRSSSGVVEAGQMLGSDPSLEFKTETVPTKH